MTGAGDVVRAAIADHGPIPYSELVDLALYHPDVGFYATGGRAGRRGDFLTSPEVGPLFGAVVARALDAWWDEAGRPEPWTVVEAGAGPGTLARSVRAARPECRHALRWVLVERSDAQRELHADLIDGGVGAVRSVAELPPPGDGPCVVLANELLDNLPFDLLERTPEGWAEVRVGLGGEELEEVLRPVQAGPPGGVAEAPIGSRVPVQHAAVAWLRDALALAGDGGRVVVLDYASTTADLVVRPAHDWLRTYRRHERGARPLDAIGEQDITCEVCVDQLASVTPPSSDRSQAEWLVAHGIDVLVDEGRRTWEERAAIGDLTAVRARSRLTEVRALVDPAGLGAFRVVEWSPAVAEM